MFLHLFLLFFAWRNFHVFMAMASDTISIGQSLSGNQTLISHGGDFELGFFSPGNSQNYYIGIWYKKIPGKTVFWVANRENPVSNTSTAQLKISEDGNLVILNSSKSIIWSSNSATSNTTATSVVLLDTGNLVMKRSLDSSSVVWQSFDHPTDSWMPGGRLGMNKITKEYQSATAWKSADNPAPGPFSQSLDPDGSDQYVLLWNGSQVYWTSGLWNGKFFTNVPGTGENTGFNLTFTEDAEGKFAMYTVTNISFITRSVVSSDGQLRQWLWFNDTRQWQTVFTQPLTHCDVYSLCGPFGICEEKNSIFCSCPVGFEPISDHEWLLNNWNSGCKRKTKLKCDRKSNDANHGKEDGFLSMDNVRLPANPQSSIMDGEKECKLACLDSCSCNGYSYGNGRCSIWDADLRNLQQDYSGDSSPSGMFFLRLASSDLPHSTSKHKLIIAVTSGVLAGIVVLLVCLLGVNWTFRKQRSDRLMNQTHGSLIQFTYGDLQHVTKNFSQKLGGGGFGPVFKGKLPDSTEVAVKMLEGLRQGEKQFRTEVSTLGAIQHVNLVRLRGFCCQGSKRLLVYEYMPGGSLDSHLFLNLNGTVLDWKKRYQIVLGIAKGLAYLHDECRERIIHCDVKPDNILLDADFCAKVADFGMAKLVGHDFSRVLTSMRGTIGYLAPEWLSGLPITPKVDVYSFGMMLFEVISGKRNSMGPEDDVRSFYLSFVAKSIREDSTLGFLDERLADTVDVQELNRVSRVACWCIQDSENQRPTMAQVVQILEGIAEVEIPPFPKGLKQRLQDEDQDIEFLLPFNDKEISLSQESVAVSNSVVSQGR